MKIAAGVVLCIGVVLSSASHAAFKCVSPAGKVSFQDLPCEKDSASKELKVERAPAAVPEQKKSDSSSADKESAAMERQIARTACSRAQSKWDTTLTALETLVAKNPDADKRAEGMQSVEKMRQKNRDIDLDKCAEKYMSDSSYAEKANCIAYSMTPREAAACRGLSFPGEAGAPVWPKDAGPWPPK